MRGANEPIMFAAVIRLIHKALRASPAAYESRWASQ